MPEPKAARGLQIASIALLGAALAILTYGDVFGQNAVAGIAVLLAIPFALGAIASSAFDPYGEAPPHGCLYIPALVTGMLALVGWLVFGEGAICLAMIVPLWLAIAVGGALTNLFLRWRRKASGNDDDHDDQSRLRTSALALIPVVALTFDLTTSPHWQEHAVTRSIEIDASADAIWPLLVSIPDISPSEGHWTMTQNLLGVPRPSEARLVREGSHLVRKARWGENIRFEERITTLEPARAIEWSFAFPDTSVQRHTDRHIAPAGPMLRIQSGRYDLEAIAPGRTRVTLTTRYISRVRLDGYFAWWGERMLGDIESNVLAIVRTRTERRTALP